MEWTQPHFLTVSIKGPRWYISTICHKKSEEGPDDEGFNARHRFGKEHLSYPRGRLQGRGLLRRQLTRKQLLPFPTVALELIRRVSALLFKVRNRPNWLSSLSALKVLPLTTWPTCHRRSLPIQKRCDEETQLTAASLGKTLSAIREDPYK